MVIPQYFVKIITWPGAEIYIQIINSVYWINKTAEMSRIPTVLTKKGGADAPPSLIAITYTIYT